MSYLLKTIIRFLFSFPLVMRNCIYEYLYSGIDVREFEGGDALLSNGFAVFSKPLDQDQLEELRADFSRIAADNPYATSGQLAGRISTHGSLSDIADTFVDRYRPMAEAYFGSEDIRCELTMYQRSWPKKSLGDVPGGEYHIDDNKRNLKFFIYLTDVGHENGPFCYVPNTHKVRGVKTILRWWLWEVFRLRMFLYGFLSDAHELEKRAQPIVGNAGLCFCADTTGMHKAVEVEEGERGVFVVSFTRNVFRI